ncbi:MAG: signal peptidase I [Elusimicrobia bacterium]|nr:signal peptidase I [Elusimicrobiota bacterium]
MKRWFFLLSLGALGAWILRGCLVEGIVIATASMEPILPVGYHAFVNKAIYKVRQPKRGEVVVLPSPAEDKDVVKRVIAVGGDEVRIEKKQVLINGQAVNEPYVQHTRADEMLVGDNIEPGRVPRNHVFVLGDNRDESGDSRDWKDPETGRPVYFIPVENLMGKVMGVD